MRRERPRTYENPNEPRPELGLVEKGFPDKMPALLLKKALPTSDLSAAPKVALDGVSLWPGDNFHPSKCVAP